IRISGQTVPGDRSVGTLEPNDNIGLIIAQVNELTEAASNPDAFLPIRCKKKCTADHRVDCNVPDDAPSSHQKQMALIGRDRRCQRPDVAVAIFGEGTRGSRSSERPAAGVGNRGKVAALVGHHRIGDAEPDTSYGILEETTDLPSWKSTPRIDRPHALAVDDV